MSFDEWMTWFTWQGNSYATGADATAAVAAVGVTHGTVASAVFARQLVLSQVRFVFRSIARGRDYGRMFGGPSLARLEQPGGGLTRSTLLRAMEAHVSCYGNAYAHATPSGGCELWRPDLVDIFYGREDDNDDPAGATVLGYGYWRRGKGRGEPEIAAPGTIAHWRPEPLPKNPHLGMSWITNVIREVVSDGHATTYIEDFFEHAATPNAIVKPDKSLTPAKIEEFRSVFEQAYAGAGNAYKTWWIGGGSDVTVVGSKLGELALRDLQGGFETRIGARSRVPASVLGTREGMQGSALNAGNYSATRRMWADGWFSPTVQDLCGALQTIVAPPAGAPAELWYDATEVLFLQEDEKDAADITQADAVSIRQLVEAGFQPDAAVAAVKHRDLSQLAGKHTGMSSVQLQAPANPTSSEG